MARHTATLEQSRIIEHADYLFDLDWKQATSEDTINFDVSSDDRDDLETFMGLHDYELWTVYRETPNGYEDISFMKE